MCVSVTVRIVVVVNSYTCHMWQFVLVLVITETEWHEEGMHA